MEPLLLNIPTQFQAQRLIIRSYQAGDGLALHTASLKEAKLQAAKALIQDPKITVEDVAKQLGIFASIFYRHFPGSRSGIGI